MDQAVEQLSVLFPRIDQEWLRIVAKQHKRDTVFRVTEKILELQYGHYPLSRDDNTVLQELLERFPGVDPAHCRQLIIKTKGGKLDTITEELLKGYPRINRKCNKKDLFPSKSYINHCRQELLNLYPLHWKSTIDAAMAECNSDFASACKILDTIKPSAFWDLIPFSRRSLVKITLQDPELQQEMLHLQYPREHPNDHQLALELNEQEYLEKIECLCCYNDVTIEEMVPCSNAHLFCKKCIENLLNEGMYGQGHLRAKRMYCMCQSECQAEIPESSIQQAVPKELFSNYMATFFYEQMQQAKIEQAHCPFCNYCEELPPKERDWQIVEEIKANLRQYWKQQLTMLLLTGFLLTPLSIETMYLFLFGFAFTKRLMDQFRPDLWMRLERWIVKVLEPKKIRFPVLNCKNSDCMKASCVGCKKEWDPPHECHSEEKDSLRLHVEQAMSTALIRTVSWLKVVSSVSDQILKSGWMQQNGLFQLPVCHVLHLQTRHS
ncbi:hypothetical protein EDD86DRAFT_114973 [Gorgonomyces haynaldii]|nr:hypothetical protein EDD86DRAFT_114973 [Gorgonomyces haynaldii]